MQDTVTIAGLSAILEHGDDPPQLELILELGKSQFRADLIQHDDDYAYVVQCVTDGCVLAHGVATTLDAAVLGSLLEVIEARLPQMRAATSLLAFE